MAGWPLPRVRTHFRASHKTCAVFSGLGKCSNGAHRAWGHPGAGLTPILRTQELCNHQPRSTLSTSHLPSAMGMAKLCFSPFIFLVIALFEATAPSAPLSQNAFLDEDGSVSELRWGGYF